MFCSKYDKNTGRAKVKMVFQIQPSVKLQALKIDFRMEIVRTAPPAALFLFILVSYYYIDILLVIAECLSEKVEPAYVSGVLFDLYPESEQVVFY